MNKEFKRIYNKLQKYRQKEHKQFLLLKKKHNRDWIIARSIYGIINRLYRKLRLLDVDHKY